MLYFVNPVRLVLGSIIWEGDVFRLSNAKIMFKLNYFKNLQNIFK